MLKPASTIQYTQMVGIGLIQIIDILIHAATDQLEFLRVASNLVILVWLAILLIRKPIRNQQPVTFGAIGIYVVLNLIFLAREGLTNPEQNGAPRVMLFILVFLTISLSIWLALKRGK